MRKSCCIISALLAVVLSLSLCGCFGLQSAPDVAATVGDVEILEEDVTAYIEGFRSQNESYETDSGWAEYLADCGYTAETLRKYVLEEVFIPNVLIESACDDKSIVVSDEDVDQAISADRTYYEQSYGDATWDSVLSSYGYDEDSWRESERVRLLRERLEDAVVGEVSVSNSQVLQEAREKGSEYSGKCSYYLSFNTKEAALTALGKLTYKKNGATTLKRFSKLGTPVRAGWNSIAADVREMSNQYITALNKLEQGDVSTPVEIDEQWVLIFCNKVYTFPEDTSKLKLSKIPAAILQQLRQDAIQDKKDEKFEKWLAKLQKKTEIVENSMPDDLSYDVDIPLQTSQGN